MIDDEQVQIWTTMLELWLRDRNDSRLINNPDGGWTLRNLNTISADICEYFEVNPESAPDYIRRAKAIIALRTKQ